MSESVTSGNESKTPAAAGSGEDFPLNLARAKALFEKSFREIERAQGEYAYLLPLPEFNDDKLSSYVAARLADTKTPLPVHYMHFRIAGIRWFEYVTGHAAPSISRMPEIKGILYEANAAEFTAAVRKSLADIPDGIATLLKSRGYKVYAGRTIADCDNGLNERDAQSLGLHVISGDQRYIALGQAFLYAVADYKNILSDDPYRTALHETGHALDFAIENPEKRFTNITDMNFFKRLYREDIKNIEPLPQTEEKIISDNIFVVAETGEKINFPKEQPHPDTHKGRRWAVSSFLTREDGGFRRDPDVAMKELFAELTASVLSGFETKPYLLRTFPRCAQAVKEIINGIESDMAARTDFSAMGVKPASSFNPK